MFLTELYLIFIRKFYKRTQIYNFFDKSGKGIIGYGIILEWSESAGNPVHSRFTEKGQQLSRQK